MTMFTWSKTAASNNTSDSTINYREGQAPSTINNSARAVMAAVAKYRDDISGALNTSGSSTAYTVTSNQSYTSLSDGIIITARMHTASGAAPTLNVDSLGAKAIRSNTSTALASGALNSGGIYTFTYDSGDDCWYIHSYIITSTRDSLGLDTDDSPQFAGINLGHASDTTITRTGAGDIAVEGNGIYRAGGTDVPITDGGTGASTAATAFANLKQAASDSATGVIEIAVQSEMEAGSSTTLAVTPGRQHFHPGHPKAGGSFNGTGTPAFRSGDYGMGAITDNGSGNYTLALDTAFADTNYWWAGQSEDQLALSEITGGRTTSALGVLSGAGTDRTSMSVALWGDYA